MKKRLLGLALVFLACFELGTFTSSCSAASRTLSEAPDFTGGISWLNTNKPIHISDLRGKVVLLDFWTFCCINCMHIIPDLKKLEQEYPKDLVVIGVHSAKFDNEKETDNIRKAIMRYGIEHPVVNDANFAIWKAYGVNAWPTLVLIDQNSHIVSTVSGEGNYELLNQEISQLIKNSNKQRIASSLKLELEKDKVKEQSLTFPGKIIADPNSNRLFISDSGHNRIIIIDTKGDLLSVIGSGDQGSKDGSFSKASFHHPQGLAYHNNILYIADTENHKIRKADLSSKSVTTIAGTGLQGNRSTPAGLATAVALSSPWDLALVGNKLFIAMAGNHQIWQYDLKTNYISPYAGSGREDIIDGPLNYAALAQPSGIVLGDNKLYFVDSESSSVREADLNQKGHVHTIVGLGLFDFGDKDGTGSTVRLQHPLGITWYQGKLYIADSYNHKIKIIDPNTKSVHTIAGTGKSGFADKHPARFFEPGGLTIKDGHIYIADTNNNVIRVINLKNKDVTTLWIKNLKP